jgi:hypothetical protein
MSFAASLTRNSYLHRLRLKRLRLVEAMVKQQQHAQWGQLDLLVVANSELQCQRLDPMVRVEVTGLLKLLLNESIAALAKATEAADE